jgi:hypothetical protein
VFLRLLRGFDLYRRLVNILGVGEGAGVGGLGEAVVELLLGQASTTVVFIAVGEVGDDIIKIPGRRVLNNDIICKTQNKMKLGLTGFYLYTHTFFSLALYLSFFLAAL